MGFILRLMCVVGSAVLAVAAAAPTPATEPSTRLDRFGVQQLNPTCAGGREYTAAWDNGHARNFGGQIDPDDPWFDTDHGNATYQIDGNGCLTATGNTVRMYVHDPKCQAMWSPNLEVTVYVTRLAETNLLAYSGVQIFARTNHGTIGRETVNFCDDRGYGAKVTLDGRFVFEKETHHGTPHGYPNAPATRPWPRWPVGTMVGIKYILRDCEHGRQVRLELWRDPTGGQDGGQWVKVTEYTDTGQNWGSGADPPKPGVDPALPLTLARMLPDSESAKPMITVYLRHECATMSYRKLSVREIDPLP